MEDEQGSTTQAPQVPEFDKDAFVAKIKAKYNGAADVALAVLGSENFELRHERKELKDKVPAPGSVILTADEAKQFQAFKDLALEPSAIKAQLEKVPELEKTAKELAQMENYREVAAISGYKVSVLKKLMAEHPDAKFEFKTEKDKDGKETKVALIRNGDKELPFTEFAEANFADFLPALKAEAEPQRPFINGTVIDPKPADRNAPTAGDNAAMAAQARSTRSHF